MCQSAYTLYSRFYNRLYNRLHSVNTVSLCRSVDSELEANAVAKRQRGRKTESGRPGGCRTNNLTNKNLNVYIIYQLS